MAWELNEIEDLIGQMSHRTVDIGFEDVAVFEKESVAWILEKVIKEYNEELEELVYTNEEWRNRIEELEAELDEADDENDQLRDELNDAELAYQDLQEEFDRLEDEALEVSMGEDW